MSRPVVVLAGGTGGAKLARGMLDAVGHERLVVIANPGDDIEVYGAYVSPDPDLVSFWLADQVDERGWGLRGDTFAVMDGLRRLGVEVWFNLGDRDLAIGIERARHLRDGGTPTSAQAAINRSLGVQARVLPASDQPVRTRVMARDEWYPFQEFMIRERGEGPVQDVDFRGAAHARPSEQVLDVLAHAEAVIIGPSNPIASIGPMLALAELRAALAAASAPVVAVSPIVKGQVLKGPTAAFMEWAGLPLSSDGIARCYEGLIDGLVADQRDAEVPVLETSLLMDGAATRVRLAEETLAFAKGLA